MADLAFRDHAVVDVPLEDFPTLCNNYQYPFGKSELERRSVHPQLQNEGRALPKLQVKFLELVENRTIPFPSSMLSALIDFCLSGAIREHRFKQTQDAAPPKTPVFDPAPEGEWRSVNEATTALSLTVAPNFSLRHYICDMKNIEAVTLMGKFTDGASVGAPISACIDPALSIPTTGFLSAVCTCIIALTCTSKSFCRGLQRCRLGALLERFPEH